MHSLEIITTADGSHTLRNPELNETYHSVHGALRESLHVFIDCGLAHCIERHQLRDVSILEVGFGTGLNALLAFQYAVRNKIRIHYTTIEPFPLTEDIWSQLNYTGGDEDRERFRAIHQAQWAETVQLSPDFSLFKAKSSLEQVQLARTYHVIFFDAFAPGKQPELWSLEALAKVITYLKPGGIFVTYSAKGQLKRDLKSLGMTVETLPGPPGKKEMVRGVR
jgi:tRNA U34 5-methylaminomethyl-2-thiouridine-forming methyltransferase MnmC